MLDSDAGGGSWSWGRAVGPQDARGVLLGILMQNRHKRWGLHELSVGCGTCTPPGQGALGAGWLLNLLLQQWVAPHR